MADKILQKRLPVSFDNILLSNVAIYGLVKTIELNNIFYFGGFGFIFFLLTSTILLIIGLTRDNLPLNSKTILSLAFIGNDYYFYIICAIILLFALSYSKIQFNLLSKCLIVLFAYVILVSIIGHVMEFLPLNLFFSFIFFGGIYIVPFLLLRKKTNSIEKLKIIHFFRKLIILQLVLVIFQSIIGMNFNPGDWGIGSLESTDKVGFFVFLLLLKISLIRLIMRTNKKILDSFFLILFFSIWIILIDAKIVYVCYLVGFIFVFFYISFYSFKLPSKLSLRGWLLVSLGIIVSIFVSSTLVSTYSSKILNERSDMGSTLRKYITDKDANQKFLLYQNAFSEIKKESLWAHWFGTGIGKFGSKTSNAFAKDVLYKDPNNSLLKLLPTTSSYWTKKYYKGLYTKEVFESIKYRSANLSFPFAGIVTIKVEFGWFGLILFVFTILAISYKTISRSIIESNSSLAEWGICIGLMPLALILLMLFDNYQEFPQIVIPTLVLNTIFNSDHS